MCQLHEARKILISTGSSEPALARQQDTPKRKLQKIFLRFLTSCLRLVFLVILEVIIYTHVTDNYLISVFKRLTIPPIKQGLER